MSAELWLSISFLLFCALTYRSVSKFISRMLQSKIDSVQQQIEESITIRNEAEKELAKTVTEHNAISDKCAAVLETTQRKVESLKKEADSKLLLIEDRNALFIKQSLDYEIEILSRKLYKEVVSTVVAEAKKELTEQSYNLVDTDAKELQRLFAHFTHIKTN